MIAQISNLHVGSLSSPVLIDKAAEIIAEQDPDATVFTSDLDNAAATEANDFVDSLSTIKGNSPFLATMIMESITNGKVTKPN